MAHISRISYEKKALAIILLALAMVVAIVTFANVGRSLTAVLTSQEATTTTNGVSLEDKKNQENHLKNMYNWVKDRRRDVQQIKKEVKGTVDTSTAEKLINDYEQCLAKLQSAIGTNDFWNMNQDCSTQDVDDYYNDVLAPLRDCANSKRNIDQRKKEKKDNLDRQLKDILRNDKSADVSALTNIFTQMDAQFTKAGAIVSSTCTSDQRDILRDAESELNTLFQDAYTTSNDINQTANQSRQLQENKKDFESNIKKGCEKDKAREMKKADKEIAKLQKQGALTEEYQTAYDNLKAVHTKLCVDLLGTMQQAIQNGDVDTFNDARNEFWTSDRDFWDTLNATQQSVQEEQQKVETLKNVNRDLQQKVKEIARMKRDIGRIKKTYNRVAKKFANREDRKEALAAFAGFITQSEELVSKIENGITTAKDEAAADPDSYWFDHNDELNELQNEFFDLQNSVNNIMNLMQNLKDSEKSLKNYKRELKDITRESGNDKELVGDLQSLLDQMTDAYKRAWSAGIADPDEGMAIMQDIFDLQNEWNNRVNDWREARYSNGEEENSNGGSYTQVPRPPPATPFSPPAPLPTPTSSATQ